MNAAQLWPLARRAAVAWHGDHARKMGAALAYYTLFSITPLLLIAVSVAGLAFGEDAARGRVAAELSGLVGAPTAAAVQSLLQNVARPRQGVLAAGLGAATMLIGAAAVFAELQSALDRIWRAPPRGAGGALIALVRSRLRSFAMVLAAGVLLLASLLASTALAAFGRAWPLAGGGIYLMHAAGLTVSLGLLTLTFAALYKLVPRASVTWPDVWTGAAATALLVSGAGWLLGLALGRLAPASPFGAAGSLIAFMVFTYYSAQVFLLGAEFTWVYAHAHGSRSAAAVADRRV